MKHLQSCLQTTQKASLKKIICKVWRGITRDYLENRYQSMPRHIQGVIDIGGGHTKYKVINIYNLRQLLVNK